MSNIIITFSFNNKYKKFCDLLCDSISRNVKCDHNVVARCVNVDDRDVESLKKKYPYFKFIVDNQKLSTEFRYVKQQIPVNNNKHGSIITDRDFRKKMFHEGSYKHDVDVAKYSEEIVYTCHSRFANILYIMQSARTDDVILCIDVDSVVNRDLIDIHQDIGDGDIMIHKDANDEFTEEGCFAIKVNKRTEQFVTNVNNTIQQNATDWDIDGAAIKENIDLLQSTQLNIRKYKNKFFEPHSVIWSGDSHVKNDARWKQLLK